MNEGKFVAGEQIIGLVLAVLGVAIAFGGMTLGLGDANLPGPGFFPLIAGLALTIFAGVVLWDTKGKDRATEWLKEWAHIRWKHILLTFASLIIYANILESVGFIIGTVLVLMVLFRSYESEIWVLTILKSALISIIVYIVFEKVFQLNLPQGILGF